MAWLTFCWKPLLLVSMRTWYQTSHDYSFGWRFWANAAAHTNIYCAHLRLFTITTSRTNPHKVDMNREADNGAYGNKSVIICAEEHLHTDTTGEQTHLCGFTQAHKHTLFTYFPESARVLFPLSLLVPLDNSKASTDPLLAGLVSAFVVVAAIMSVLLFLKFRNTNDGPEFRRLQDLPMVRLRSTIHLKNTHMLANTMLSNSHVKNIQRWQGGSFSGQHLDPIYCFYSSSFKKIMPKFIFSHFRLKLRGS